MTNKRIVRYDVIKSERFAATWFVFDNKSQRELMNFNKRAEAEHFARLLDHAFYRGAEWKLREIRAL